MLLSFMNGCGLTRPTPETEAVGGELLAEPWPEADRMFFDNPHSLQWKGADVANSVALGDSRILWVFGDTLLTQPGVNSCDRFGEFAIPVHNSLALQYGSNPVTASIRHYWGHNKSGDPESFFTPDKPTESWFWMGGVTVLQDQLLVFLMHARSSSRHAGETPPPSCAGLDFEILGWQARIAKITADEPSRWQWRDVRLPEDRYWQQILVGSSTVSVDESYLYAWSAGPAGWGGNPVYLARWPIAAASRGDLIEPFWFTEAGWQSQTRMGKGSPAVIVADGNNENAVASGLWPGEARDWWWLQSSQIMNSPLCYRNGDSPLAWGECHDFFYPPELASYPDSRLLVYAPRMHPALTGQGDDAVVATYVVNSCDLKDIQNKCDLYYPRFIKLRLNRE